ncbi:MAG: hypothetical protein EON60_05995 [Alphaproteobacteria bacterium]|nr:MAG: hypothetical protein EON60_05995 [Alphaproteobacteria bacterium]
MPTYILHGGEASSETPTNAAFWQYMAESLPEGGTWVGCYFARYIEFSDTKFERDAAKIRSFAPQGVMCVMATEDNFEDLLKSASVLYLAGGSSLGLLNNLGRWPNAKSLIQAVPVVAGCSAGMNILGNKFLTKKGELGQGLGIIPYNLLVHHRAPHYSAVQVGAPLPPPVLAVHETQFCTIQL